MLAAHVLVISQREAEMARLAAQGRSSREIADDYRLARRTVENHLASAYRKLDIHGRDDLREIYSRTLADLPADLIDRIADIAE
jgi:DNA-binding CsgD family transcriptional regulator